MKRIIAVTAVAVSLAAGSFAGGTWWAHRSGAARASAHAATVYTCPMHPDYRSDHPGDCPICGMRLEADRAASAPASDAAPAALPAGAVQVSPERQQAIGIRLGVVGRSAGTRLLRTTGRVAPDENRTYPIVAAVSGWIRNVESVTTGDAVKKDQVLASFVAPELEFRSAQQSYYTGLEAFYRMAVTQPQPQPQSPSHAAVRGEAIDRMADALRNMGVSNSQLREMGKRRELVHDIRVESPVDGVRAEAQRLARPPVRSRLRVLPDRGSEPRVDSGRRVPRPAAVHPPRRLRADHHGGSQPRAVGDGESVGADLRRGDADAEGAARGGEPAAGAQARHVRRRGVPGRPPADARRAGGCDRGLGAAQNGVRRARQRILRAAAGRDGVAHRRRRRGDERAHARRADRDLRHLLRRFREPHEGGRIAHGHRPRRCSIRCAACTWIPRKPATPAARRRTARTSSSSARTTANSSSSPTRPATRSRRSRSHDRTHHRLLGQEQVPRPAARGRRRARRRARAAERAARRDPRPRRHAGHRLLAVGSQPRPHRGAGHVSDRDGDAWRAARAGGPRRLRLWLLVRLRDLRGRHRHLLGAHADAGVPLGRAVAAAARFADGARARRDRSRLGVPVRARGPLGQTQPRGSAVVPGLVPALLPEGGARRVGGGLARRLRPGSTR